MYTDYMTPPNREKKKFIVQTVLFVCLVCNKETHPEKMLFPPSTGLETVSVTM